MQQLFVQYITNLSLMNVNNIHRNDLWERNEISWQSQLSEELNVRGWMNIKRPKRSHHSLNYFYSKFTISKYKNVYSVSFNKLLVYIGNHYTAIYDLKVGKKHNNNKWIQN